MQKEYKTVLQFGTAILEEKKSRFIASVMPAKSEAAAVLFINSLKSKYWDASHNVYSYFINGSSTIQRYSDDGEPSGTAGVPVLEVIKRCDLQDLVVVVARYFGGTLLGAAGLIRAYSKSASLGVEAAGIIKKQLCFDISLTVEYTLFGKVQSMLASNNYAVKNIKYLQDVDIKLFIPVDEYENFNRFIIEITNARALIETGEEVYITLGEDGKLIL